MQDGEDRVLLIGQLFERTCVCSTLNDDQCLSQLFQRDQKAPSELTILLTGQLTTQLRVYNAIRPLHYMGDSFGLLIATKLCMMAL